MSSNSDNKTNQKVARRAHELRSEKNFDPRKENELNDLYNQYVPPHANEETSHLVDVAERDAYIDPFPPIGSQKMAGAAVKKGVRVAIGWYIQYIAQQISTFGSGVAQALRALHNDVDILKQQYSSSDTFGAIKSLNLETISSKEWSVIAPYLSDVTHRVVIADALPDDIDVSVDHVVVDPRSRVRHNLSASTDTRDSDLLPFLSTLEDQSLGGLVVHGRSDFLDNGRRIELVAHASRVLRDNAPFIYCVRTHARDNASDAIAAEVTGTQLWSAPTWEYILSDRFTSCTRIDENKGHTVFLCRNGE